MAAPTLSAARATVAIHTHISFPHPKYARRLKRAQLKRQHERAELQARVLELEVRIASADGATTVSQFSTLLCHPRLSPPRLSLLPHRKS